MASRAVVDAVEALDDVGQLAGRCSVLDVLDLRELVVVDHREVEHDLPRVLGGRGEQVALRARARASSR